MAKKKEIINNDKEKILNNIKEESKNIEKTSKKVKNKKERAKKENKLVGFILNVLLVVVSIIILIGIYYIVQIKVLNKDYADMFGYTFFEVATGSMSPTIKKGDVVIVEITKELEEDDIIVYKEENNYITHRLIKINGSELITKGDANNSEDKPIKTEQTLGKVSLIIPKVGVWRKIFLSPEILRTNKYCYFLARTSICIFLKNGGEKR